MYLTKKESSTFQLFLFLCRSWFSRVRPDFVFWQSKPRKTVIRVPLCLTHTPKLGEEAVPRTKTPFRVFFPIPDAPLLPLDPILGRLVHHGHERGGQDAEDEEKGRQADDGRQYGHVGEGAGSEVGNVERDGDVDAELDRLAEDVEAVSEAVANVEVVRVGAANEPVVGGWEDGHWHGRVEEKRREQQENEEHDTMHTFHDALDLITE